MTTLAIVENGSIVNIVVAEVGQYTPGPGQTVVELPAGFGRNDLYDGNSFSKPAQSLADRKSALLRRLNGEGLTRVQAVYPAIADMDALDLEVDRWLSIAPAARQPVADFQSMIDIVVAWRAARGAIRASNDPAFIDSYNVVTDPSWP